QKVSEMNPTSRTSRWAAVSCFVPVFVVCALCGAGYALIGISGLLHGQYSMMGGVAVGSMAFLLAIGCGRKMRDILRSQAPPWGPGTRMAIAGDVLLALLIMVAIPKIQELRRYSANGTARGHLGILRQALIDYQK